MIPRHSVRPPSTLSTRPHRRPRHLVAMLIGTLLAFIPLASLSAQESYDPGADRATDVGGGINDQFASRDNTRVMGTVRDGFGNPINEIEITVRNDDAPASQLIARTRKSGTYLVRDISRLWSRENVTGITLRLRFEGDGLEPFESTVGVAKNGLAELHPILWENGQEKNLGGWCVIVKGTVSDNRGKKVKSANVVFTSRQNPEFRVEVEAKKGEYEALLWAAPDTIDVAVEIDGDSAIQDAISFGSDPVTDRVRVALKDFVLP